MEGKAKIIDSNAFSIVGDSEYQCQISFTKNEDKFELKTINSNCSTFQNVQDHFL